MVLAVKSYYSLRYGVLSPENLVKIAALQGHKYLGLADINNTSAAFDFIKACNENNIKPIVGMEFQEDDEFLYLILAKNHEGFHQMNLIYSQASLNKEKLQQQPSYSENYNVVYNINSAPKRLNNNEFIGIRAYELTQIHKLIKSYPEEKLVILHRAFYLYPKQFTLHKHLRAIHYNTMLSQLTEKNHGNILEKIPNYEAFKNYFASYPFLIENTDKLVADINFTFDYKSSKNLQTFTGTKQADVELLHKLSNEGLQYRYPENQTEAHKRVKHELKVIEELGFVAYFLITWDIIRFAKQKRVYHVGRGSGANSIVAYCLGITDVDPIELNLYFERFINPKRNNPPDFDIDFSWKDRDSITDYIFSKYKEYAALLGTSNTFRDRSTLREMAKVYGLPNADIDLLVKHPDHPQNNYELARQIKDIASQIQDFPNIRSIHAGGVLISHLPMTYYSALDMPPKGYPTVQWDMYVAEDIHLDKLDILSQRGIGHIFEAVEIIKTNRGLDIDIHNIKQFKSDDKIKDMLASGETIGAFYIESPAMRGLLRKLRCRDYISLVAASSIIRPGVAKSGMMREYIQRFNHPEKIKYLHPVMEEQLKETFGIMVYQEDVLKVCHHYADLELSDADVLRRIMSGKARKKGEFERITQTFFENSKRKGYPEHITQEVWRQIESFAGYSFSKAHSASYAVESFQSLFLKAYYPLEFIVGVINNFGGFYSRSVYFNEAKRYGAELEAPEINISNYVTRLLGTKIYIGFIHIEGLESNFIQQTIQERELNGVYSSFENFMERNRCSKEQMIILIRTGCFRFTNESKSALLWKMNFYLAKKEVKSTTQVNELFQLPYKRLKLPEFTETELSNAFDELEFLHFPVKLSLFDMVETPIQPEIYSLDMLNNVNKTAIMLGQLIHIKYVRMSNGKIMNFGTFIDSNGNYFDTTHFATSLQNYPFKGYGIYYLKGKIIQEFGQPSLDVYQMFKQNLHTDKRFA